MKVNNGVGDKAAGKIAKYILAIQEKFSGFMNRRSASWKTSQQWIFLCVVCILPGVMSILAIIQSFKNKEVLPRRNDIHVSSPVFKEENKVLITDNEIGKVHAFRQRLDSLSRTETGKVKVEQFLRQRPGFLDSLSEVEQLYNSQNNTNENK